VASLPLLVAYSTLHLHASLTVVRAWFEHTLTLISLVACLLVSGGVTTIIIPMPLRFMLSKTVELGVYAGFMMISLYSPTTIGWTPLLGDIGTH